VRVRSEHAIGYLKARFSSLKLVPISILSLEHVKNLNSWVLAAVCLHNFALLREDGGGYEVDPLVQEYDARNVGNDDVGWAGHANDLRPAELRRGRARREELKQLLQNAMQ
jgi:hypothetical protein